MIKTEQKLHNFNIYYIYITHACTPFFYEVKWKLFGLQTNGVIQITWARDFYAQHLQNK